MSIRIADFFLCEILAVLTSAVTRHFGQNFDCSGDIRICAKNKNLNLAIYLVVILIEGVDRLSELFTHIIKTV